MFFSYILRLVCHFNVIVFTVPSNNKRHLPVNNQSLESDPSKVCNIIRQDMKNLGNIFHIILKTAL